MKEIKSLPVKRQVSVSGILKKLGVSRSGYNAWKKRVPSDTSVRRAVLKEKIQKIYEESHQNYGAPKITAELRKSGEYVSEKTVGNYMRQMGIKAHWVKPYVQTTIDSDFSQKLKNILNEEFNPAHPDAVWCSDITYIWTFEGFVYLTSVMDLYSRKIISWVLSETLEASHVVECVEKAKHVRNVEKPLIFHCDRGCQYVSEAFQKATKGMIHSYSKKAYPWDNACIESFHALLRDYEEKSVNKIFYDNDRRKTGMKSAFRLCFIYNSYKIACQERAGNPPVFLTFFIIPVSVPHT